jgi:hypothetical protein
MRHQIVMNLAVPFIYCSVSFVALAGRQSAANGLPPNFFVTSEQNAATYTANVLFFPVELDSTESYFTLAVR